jgi:hypothetical protein
MGYPPAPHGKLNTAWATGVFRKIDPIVDVGSTEINVDFPPTPTVYPGGLEQISYRPA